MISTELSDSGLPDNLPLLTQVVETDTPDDLPTLTDVVAEVTEAVADTAKVAAETNDQQPAVLAAQENEIDTLETEPDNETQSVVSEKASAPENIAPEAITHPPRALSEEELQQILHHLEAHLDAMLASKLSLHFEKLRDALNAHLDSKIQ